MADNLEEFLDIVDEDDVVTGSRNRNDVHIFGLLHREVHVWFFDKKNNIFFQKRGVNKSSGGLFDATVGGHVDSEEDYSTAAIREVKEEVGLEINFEDLVVLKKFRETYTNGDKVNNFYRLIFVYKNPISDIQIKKEEGVTGVDFKKFSPDYLLNVNNEERVLFDEYIINDEIPAVINFLNSK